jgi:hypothetical protein
MRTPQNPKPQQTAEAAYEQAHVAAQNLTDRIHELLADLPAPGLKGHRISWPQVGTLAEVNRRLAAVVAFLEGTEV